MTRYFTSRYTPSDGRLLWRGTHSPYI